MLANSQQRIYRVANAHSHNDYEQPLPFNMAYDAGFGSIEADIFLVGDSLFVAHDTTELKRKIDLVSAYLFPLMEALKKHYGYPYADTSKRLQMLIDIKTDSINTLAALINLLQKYPLLLQSNKLNWVITGNRPDPSLFKNYPSYILFDGELYRDYSKEALEKIVLLSDNFARYSLWDGKSGLPAKDEAVLTTAVKKAKLLHKPVRFWNCPDNARAWKQLIKLNVDYINTDHIAALAQFLKDQ
jgi:alkaline phosphatase